MTVASLTAAERETVVVVSDADGLANIDTERRVDIRRMRKDPAFTEIASGWHGCTEWARFTIPSNLWSPCGVKRARKMTDSQKAAGIERLKVHRRGHASPDALSVVVGPTENAA